MHSDARYTPKAEHIYTYVEEAVDERVIAGVAHCQTVAAQPDDVDISVSRNTNDSSILSVFFPKFFPKNYTEQ